MKKVKLLVFLIAIVLISSGFAYASWVEQVQFHIKAKTAYTELQVLKAEADGIHVDTTAQSQVTIQIKDIEQGESGIADITFINTGTIPLIIDNIAISSVGGYEAQNKNKIYLDILAIAGGKTIFNSNKQISYWKSNGSVKCRSGLTEIPVGSTVTIRVKISFEDQENIKAIDQKAQNKPQVFENVTFILRPEYSCFNEDKKI